MRDQTERVLSETRELGSVAAARGFGPARCGQGKGRRILTRTKDESQRYADSVESYVVENPMRSLLVAAGVGAALVLLLKR
jgi:ElaB/YqjD/DUF883 family membrane-anchored ribosome-binding protein